MEIVVFAKRFRNGNWEPWEHKCSVEEINSVADSARARADNRGWTGAPIFADYLNGARYIFDATNGPRDAPKDGDTQIYGVCIEGMDGVMTAMYEELRYQFKVGEVVA